MELDINGTASSNEADIAEEFNRFFSTIGEKISNSIPNTNIDPLYCTDNKNVPLFTFDHIHGGEVLSNIRNLESKSSTDIFGFNTKLIKFVDTAICNPLAHIFTISLKDGIFPKLKCSRVVPVFKNGDRKKCNNYRPISLVSIFSKIIEKIVSYKLTNHLQLYKLLTPNQFYLSTEHNLIHLTNFISDTLNDNKYVIGIFLDLQKAFDVVSHDILIKKTTQTWDTGCCPVMVQKLSIGKIAVC